MSRVIKVAILALILGPAATASAGMPTLLPTNWTSTGEPAGHGVAMDVNRGWDAPLQAISFFVVVILGSAWCVRRIWSEFRCGFSGLPELSYGGALAAVILWGLLFVVVLTMISGARELMTPGAWKKQGWTYRLAEPVAKSDSRDMAQEALAQLKTALWEYAALHGGSFPADASSELPEELLQVPGSPGLHFMIAPGARPGREGTIIAYEPSIDDERRHVLFSNGALGTMTSEEINAALIERKLP